MNLVQKENEAQFLREVILYRGEYRRKRLAALDGEREQRHSSGEVYVAGCWIPAGYAGRVVQALIRRERVVFIEVICVLVFLIVLAYFDWRLFAFLLLPALS